MITRKFATSIDSETDSELTIASYYPIPGSGELDMLEPLQRLQEIESRLKICLPVVYEKASPLKFHSYTKGDTLVPSLASAKLLEPQMLPETLTSELPHFMLVPLLAFDPVRLTRLGYGGGYYDRTLQAMQNHKESKVSCVTIGIAMECLKCENLEVDAHDQTLDFIVTEEALYRQNS